ncbi:MAG TPA: hypothetical protein VFQ51_12815 [Vicinamibacteria bacterium]|nr:hypothetical protein [Vicinamibacteria bacterium]
MLETPFLDGAAVAPTAPRNFRETPFLSESPFLSEYPEGEEEGSDPMAEMAEELLESLHDEEFDEAISELTEELRGVASSSPFAESEQDDARASLLRETVAPLVAAAEADVASVGRALESLDMTTATESEIDAAAEAVPVPGSTNPVFELFFNKWRKKILNVVKKGVSLATKLGFGPLLKMLLGRLYNYLRPLIAKVVGYALDKVPAQYRPLATSLAAKLGIAPKDAAPAPTPSPMPPATPPAPGGAGTGEPGTSPPLDQPATPDTSQAQQELDLYLTEAALAPERFERESMGAPDPMPSVAGRDPYADLARARERFVREVTEANGEAETKVVVERFVPAVLFAVRQGIKFLGRQRVVDAIGSPIAKIIAPLIGAQHAPALGKVLADVGLRTFLHAETDPETEREGVGRAIAATVEETARRLAQLPEEAFEEPEAVETFTREAFEASAAATFPAALVRPELRETERPGAWFVLPLRGRPVCRKFSGVFDVSLTPSMAACLRGYGSDTIAGLLRDRLRLPAGRPVQARVHLYEAVPGTTLAGIARMEETSGLGSARSAVWSQIQPLTPEAASLLLGSPRLGRELAEEAEPTVPAIGQRFYYLEVAGAPPRPLGRESSVRVGVHLRSGEIRLALYLSEVLAQKVAAALRGKSAAAAVVAELRTALAATTGALGTARAGRLVRIHGARRHRHPHDAAARGARMALRRQIGPLALQWAWTHLAAQLPSVAADFIARTDGPEDGVRLVFAFQVPGGLAGLAQVFRGRAVSAAGWPPASPTRATLTILAGPRRV